MARGRRSSSRRRTGNDSFPWVLAVVFGAALVAVAGGFGWLALQASANHVQLGDDLCRNTGPTEQTIVLVDATDPISPLTQQEILTRLSDVAAGLPTNGRIELRTLDPGPDRTEELFALCNPGSGAEIDGLTGNPVLAQRRWKENFVGPLQDAMGRVVSGSAGDTSPIMAALQEIAVDRLTSKTSQSIQTRIIVVSDMIENTPDFSMYASGADIDAYKSSRAASAYAVDLADATVDIWYLRRETALASLDVVNFWAEWIRLNKGRGGTAISLQGLQ